jgi:hypothetical protein
VHHDLLFRLFLLLLFFASILTSKISLLF